MNSYIRLQELSKIAKGLNIEGYRPSLAMPDGCKWYNLVQVIDEPLKGETFEKVMKTVADNNYDLIEEAVGIDRVDLTDQLASLISKIKSKHRKLLVHVHQYTGTTCLNTLLEKMTGVECILDNTNFYEHPIDYSVEYKDIDGLLSLSQCAGFDLVPGTWIIPESFMEFDVDRGIIYTAKKVANNSIDEYIDFDHVKGNVLMVNGLWNPDISQDVGYLMLDEFDVKVLEFVKENTKIFDESHNWVHAVNVARNAMGILSNREVLYLALLHDVCDHKYSESLPREKLSGWIRDNLVDYPRIDGFIDQVSFSKQKSMEKVDPVLEAVRDGDRMEAIGEVGIERCETFTRMRGGKVPEDVITHCFDKLLRLVPEGYIVNRNAEIMRRHNVIVDYVKQHGH